MQRPGASSSKRESPTCCCSKKLPGKSLRFQTENEKLRLLPRLELRPRGSSGRSCSEPLWVSELLRMSTAGPIPAAPTLPPFPMGSGRPRSHPATPRDPIQPTTVSAGLPSPSSVRPPSSLRGCTSCGHRKPPVLPPAGPCGRPGQRVTAGLGPGDLRHQRCLPARGPAELPPRPGLSTGTSSGQRWLTGEARSPPRGAGRLPVRLSGAARQGSAEPRTVP